MSFLKPQRPFSSSVKVALSEDKLWRAKEILQSTIATTKYDPLLFEQLGLVLLQMGDTLEAGEYLFLSGQAKTEYEEAIALYLQRYGRRDWQTLVASFPKRARQIAFNSYPDAVQKRLRELKIPSHLSVDSPLLTVTKPKKILRDAFFSIGCACFALLVVICLITGFGVVFDTVLSWFT